MSLAVIRAYALLSNAIIIRYVDSLTDLGLSYNQPSVPERRTARSLRLAEGELTSQVLTETKGFGYMPCGEWLYVCQAEY